MRFRKMNWLRRTVSLALILVLALGTAAGVSPLPVRAKAAKTNPVKIDSCAATGVNTVSIRATVRRATTTKDNKYYLCYVTPKVAKVKKILATVPRKGVGQVMRFRLKLVDEKTQNPHKEYIIMKYAIAARGNNGKLRVISNAKFVANPEKAAPNQKPYYVPKTKKGLQTGIIKEAIDSKANIAFFNLFASEVLGDTPKVAYRYNGKIYYFSNLSYYRYYVKDANEKGIQVTCQFMMDNAAVTRSLTYSRHPKGFLQGFRINSTPYRERIEAMLCYVSEVFADDEHYVSNWILGNEVEMGPSTWYMGGTVKLSKFIDNYARTYRIFYNAVRSARASSRVFICVGHCWNITGGDPGSFKGKSVVKKFAKKEKSLQANVNWNLAFHPHPDNLAVPTFWKDRASMTRNSINSPKITMKNLHVLTSWIRRKYGRNCRVLVSEIGFNSGAGKNKQAAAVALAYDIVACNPQVDGIMIRAYTDDRNDMVDGQRLYFGMKGRRALAVYKKMDTTAWQSATQSLLKAQVGKKWKKKVKGFSASKLYSNYRK